MSPSLTSRIMAVSFPLGALGHFWWVGKHGLLYHGPAPAWAVWFWYGLCAVDFVVCLVLLTRPRIGLMFAVVTMAISLWVNWIFFPTFEHGFNGVLIARRLKRRRPAPSPRWHLDEMVCSIGGRRMFLWRAVDDEGEVLDVLVQRRRDTEAALRLLRRLLHNQPVEPQTITTDGLASLARLWISWI